MRQATRIIVEGMDGAGKTTLIDRLCYEFHTLERVRNDLGPDQDFNTWWVEQFERTNSIITPIHDRFFYSELVYGPILRGYIAAEPSLVSTAFWFLRSTAFLIYARPYSEVLREGYRSRPQMVGTEENFQKLLEAYDQLMEPEKNWMGERFFHYDWTNPKHLPLLITAVEKYLAGNPDATSAETVAAGSVTHTGDAS